MSHVNLHFFVINFVSDDLMSVHCENVSIKRKYPTEKYFNFKNNINSTIRVLTFFIRQYEFDE